MSTSKSKAVAEALTDIRVGDKVRLHTNMAWQTDLNFVSAGKLFGIPCKDSQRLAQGAVVQITNVTDRSVWFRGIEYDRHTWALPKSYVEVVDE